jgi:dihydrodipicolinate synthase/N-acetylneuraminate lyase
MPDTLGGMMAPLVSPFDAATGELARERFERHVRYYLEAGLSGVLVAGSSGEAALLDDGRARAARRVGARSCRRTAGSSPASAASRHA